MKEKTAKLYEAAYRERPLGDPSPMGQPIMREGPGINSLKAEEEKGKNVLQENIERLATYHQRTEAEAQAIQAAERKVLEAAKVLVEGDRREGSHRSHNSCGSGTDRALVPYKEFTDFARAVDELNAIIAPAGVDPQTLKPGDKFRFDRASTQQHCTDVFQAVRVRETGNLGYVWLDRNNDGMVYVFTKSDRVIPEPKE